MKAILGLVDRDAVFGIHDCIRNLHVAPARQTVTEAGPVRESHFLFVDDEMAVGLTNRLLFVLTAEERKGAPALSVNEVGVAVGRFDIMA